ncbi:MAG: hypothetical protein IPI67_12815 [Myxococcales bacterium]|nr:hypothetical protein [Myxococcales bacterium]
MIEEQKEQSYNDSEPFSVYRPLDAGAAWAERNLARIEELIRPTETKQALGGADSDDIPF